MIMFHNLFLLNSIIHIEYILRYSFLSVILFAKKNIIIAKETINLCFQTNTGGIFYVMKIWDFCTMSRIFIIYTFLFVCLIKTSFDFNKEKLIVCDKFIES
jgi:hypothetical protein